ncbi:MAG: alpha-2-macroglobulin family protein [Bacteroidota bacterium]
MSDTPPEMYKLVPGDSYPEDWARVDFLEQKALPKSALELVEQIYAKAKSEQNHAQQIKCVIHLLKFNSEIEEQPLINGIQLVKREITTAEFPVKPVLQSLLAQHYWGYYQENAWRFAERSETADFEVNPDDPSTWDLRKIIDESTRLFLASLENADSLQRTDVGYLEAVLDTHPDFRIYRPTLYDLLAHRALEVFRNDIQNLPQPVFAFQLRTPEAFADAATFADLTWESPDTQSTLRHSLRIYQGLTRAHAHDAQAAARVLVDLARLGFAREKSVLADKDSAYLAGLEALQASLANDQNSATVAYEIAEYHHRIGESADPLGVDAEAQAANRKAHEICLTTIEDFPDSYGAGRCRNLKDRIATREITHRNEIINLPDQPFRALVQYRNVAQIWCKLVPVTEQMADDLAQLSGPEAVQLLNQPAPVQSWKVQLPGTEDFNRHRAEIAVPGVPSGQYALLIADNEAFATEGHGVSYSLLWSSRLSYTYRDLPYGQGIEFVVVDRGTGTPLAGVEAQVKYRSYDYDRQRYQYRKAETLRSDSDGMFSVSKRREGNRESGFVLDFRYQGDRLRLDDSWNIWGQRPRPKARRRVAFFTDRAIYRPGQTIFFKAMLLETLEEKTRIVPHENLVVQLYNPNWQEVGTLNLVTNEYGTCHGSFVAPQGGLNGIYQLKSLNSQTRIRVEEYKRPKFEVKFDPIKGSFRLNDEVKVVGQAQAYAGSNIDGAEVKYRVVRSTSFPYRRYRFWGRVLPPSETVEITNGRTETDGEGKFEISFSAAPDPKVSPELKPQFTYQVYADVVDITGETHSAEVSVAVGYLALSADLAIPETVAQGEQDTFSLVTRNLNGEFEAARGTVTIHRLSVPERRFRERLWEVPDQFTMTREDYYAQFPHDIYQRENEAPTWEKDRQVFRKAFDSKKSDQLVVADLKSWEPGKYVAELVTQDKFGAEVKVVKYFTLYAPDRPTIPLPAIEWYTKEQGQGEPGQAARFSIGTAEVELWVLFEIGRKGKIVDRKWLKMSNERRQVEIPIEESDRGNFSYYLTAVKHGRAFHHTETVVVPWTNKQLDIVYESFRDKLLPGQDESWNLRITGPDGEAAAAELVASMYDASLDAFQSAQWNLNTLPTRSAQLIRRSGKSFAQYYGQLAERNWNEVAPAPRLRLESLHLFGYYPGASYRRGIRSSSFAGDMMLEQEESSFDLAETAAAPPSPAKTQGKSRGMAKFAASKSEEAAPDGPMDKDSDGRNEDLGEVAVRTNLNETAFFYPDLRTDERGNVILSFTVPEALTRWRILLLAHTKDLKMRYLEKSLVTQKDLMVMPNPPRFFRENDEIEFTAKVTNLSERNLSGVASLELFDALTMQPIDLKLSNQRPRINFKVEPGRSAPLAWRLKIPADVQVVTYRVKAKAGNFTDGEEAPVPVLLNSMLVTESMPLPVRPKQSRTFTFEKMVNHRSPTLRHHKYTLEFTSNPAWYAVQALPYLMDYPYECTEQIFSRYYANALASHVANAHPKIKRVFDAWAAQGKEALTSNLEKNQELKALLLEETPWVLQAQDETQRKQRIGLLFDLNHMGNELGRALRKLQKAQVSNGAWSWFPGMPASRHITQHVLSGMGHLDRLGVTKVRDDRATWNMVRKAVGYLDRELKKDYDRLRERKVDWEKQHLRPLQIQAMYARSFFPDLKIASNAQPAYDYFRKQAQQYWTEYGKYEQGMIGLLLHRQGESATPMDIVKSLRERALKDDELGMYWARANRWCLYWNEAPIETQALLIELFDEVAEDQVAVEEMKIWLLKQKQTQDWKTTKATAEACYALLLRGTDLLAESKLAEVSIGGEVYDPLRDPATRIEAGTGYFKTSWSGGEIRPEMGEVQVTNPNEGVAWGAVYWQYFEQLDKITFAETNLKLEKQLFREEDSPVGPQIRPIAEQTALRPGDKLKVRIVLESDRDLEYVHLKDLRASGFEPINVLSQYKYQDGLGYYESTRDAATNFFIAYLRKGKYVFEYPLRVIHPGNFSNGIATIQCMYAPEFTAHSEGTRSKVE